MAIREELELALEKAEKEDPVFDDGSHLRELVILLAKDRLEQLRSQREWPRAQCPPVPAAERWGIIIHKRLSIIANIQNYESECPIHLL